MMAPRAGYGPYRGGGFVGGGPRSATCYKCGGPNHYARDCQAQAQKCYACGKLVGVNDVRRPSWVDCRFCRQSRVQPAFFFGAEWLNLEQGHISRDCTAPNGGPLNTAGRKCYRCGDAGHISKECSQADSMAEQTAAAGAPQMNDNNVIVGPTAPTVPTNAIAHGSPAPTTVVA